MRRAWNFFINEQNKAISPENRYCILFCIRFIYFSNLLNISPISIVFHQQCITDTTAVTCCCTASLASVTVPILKHGPPSSLSTPTIPPHCDTLSTSTLRFALSTLSQAAVLQDTSVTSKHSRFEPRNAGVQRMQRDTPHLRLCSGHSARPWCVQDLPAPRTP